MVPKSVFFSHSHADRVLAELVRRLLVNSIAPPITTFISSRKSPDSIGSDWYAATLSSLRNSDLVLALITPASINKKWIYFESGGAIANDIVLFPLLFGIAPTEVHDTIRRFECIQIDGAQALWMAVRGIANKLGCTFQESGFDDQELLAEVVALASDYSSHLATAASEPLLSDSWKKSLVLMSRRFLSAKDRTLARLIAPDAKAVPSLADPARVFISAKCRHLNDRPSLVDEALVAVSALLGAASKPILLLGAAGSGKTYLVGKIIASVLQDLLCSDTSDSVPVLLPLKSMDPHCSLLDQVTERIRDLGLPIQDSDDLTACLSNHRLCIFLDGLDELPLGPGAAVDDYVAFLDELTAVPNLKVVISARTGLFSDEVARFTKRFSILEMQEWDPNNWVAFLDQACTCGVLSHAQRAGLASAIERSSSLKDLATRPLYCRMMAETCDTILRHATLQESQLLELYVNNFIDRKQWPGGLKRADLLKTMRHTAFCMHAQNKFHFTVGDLAEILRRLMPAIANEKTWAEHLTTMRVHSFLDNSIDGTFAFAHAAFRSYFLADLLFAQVFSKTSEAEWSTHSWRSLGEVYVDQDVATLIVQMIESHHNVFPAEWIRSYMQFSSSDRQDFQLWRGGAPAVVFRNLVLLWTEMQRASRGGVTDASGLDLSDLNFKAPSLKNINFDRADLTRCNLAGTRVTNCTFRNARLSFANLSHARLDTCDFSGSQLHNVILSGCHFLGAANRFYGSAGFDFASLNSAQKGQIVPSLLEERREFERVGDSEAVKWLVDRLAAVEGFP